MNRGLAADRAPQPGPPQTDAACLELEPILESMVAAQQRLLAVLQTEKRLLIEGTLEGLAACGSEKEACLAALDRLEQRRQVVLAPLAAGPALTLKELTAAAAEPLRARLISCHERLDALIASTAEINQLNGLLVTKILEHISLLIGLLRQLSAPAATYRPTGRLAEDHAARSLGRG